MAPAPQDREVYRVGDLVVDVGLQRVTGPAGDIALPKLSFELLLALVRRAPSFVTNDELSSLVWGGVVVSPETVTKRVNLLREALGHDAKQPRYIAGLRSRGYRIVAPVSAEPIAATPVASSPTIPKRTAAPRTGLVAGAATGIALLALLAWWAWPEDADREATPTVAVLRFENLSPDPGDAYLALGVPDMILDQLARIPRLTVIARASAFGLPAEVDTPREIGDRLGARYIVEGSAQRNRDRMRVTARLVDARDGVQLWSTNVDRPVNELFAIQDTIADAVATELRNRTGNVPDDDVNAGYRPPIEAQLAYLQGRALLSRTTVKDAEAAAGHFQRAADLDPRFAGALAGLFDAHLLAAERRHDDLDAERRQHLPLLERALAMDADCGAAYLARAIWGTGPPEVRDADFRRGLALDPSNGRGLVAYAEFLGKLGRRDESRDVLDRALRIDPMSPRIHFLRVMRDFDTKGALAIEPGLRRVLEIDPNYHPALQRFAKYRWMQRGELAEAAQIIEHAIEVDPANPWTRHTAVAIYLDLDDVAAAEAVASVPNRSPGTGQILLALHAGDWRAAGTAALSPAGSEYNLVESWGVPEAVRDFALQTRDHEPAIHFLVERYGLLEGATLRAANIRAAACLIQLLQADGQDARAARLLEQLSPAIDAVNEKHGPVIALRTRAMVQLLAGERDTALATLAESFAAEDLMQWWYTLERDPLWRPLHDDPRFAAIKADVRARVAHEQAALANLRRDGRIVQRGAQGSGP